MTDVSRSDSLSLHCVFCGHRLHAFPSHFGFKIQCQKCENLVQVSSLDHNEATVSPQKQETAEPSLVSSSQAMGEAESDINSLNSDKFYHLVTPDVPDKELVVNEAEIKAMLSVGKINGCAVVWIEGIQDWRTLEETFPQFKYLMPPKDGNGAYHVDNQSFNSDLEKRVKSVSDYNLVLSILFFLRILVYRAKVDNDMLYLFLFLLFVPFGVLAFLAMRLLKVNIVLSLGLTFSSVFLAGAIPLMFISHRLKKLCKPYDVKPGLFGVSKEGLAKLRVAQRN